MVYVASFPVRSAVDVKDSLRHCIDDFRDVQLLNAVSDSLAVVRLAAERSENLASIAVCSEGSCSCVDWRSRIQYSTRVPTRRREFETSSLDHAEGLGVIFEELEGNSIVGRPMILDEDATVYTADISSFLWKIALISRRCHAFRLLAKNR